MLADSSESMALDLPTSATHVGAHPDEAALVAAAAAMAAAAQGHDVFKQEDVTNNFATPDLSSYFLAAAAASVQAQQLREQDKTPSEDSYDSPATRTHTNGTSLNGSDDDEANILIHSQCQKYTLDQSPCPIDAGTRCIGGLESFAEILADPTSAVSEFSKLPFSQEKVELGKTRCYWALLSADRSDSSGPTGDQLDFVYLDPVLQQHLAEQTERMIGSNFFDYVHPEETERVRDDMRNVVESRTLFGSVTRCRYSRIPRIRELLGAVNPPRDPEAHRYVEDEHFVAIDIVINWIGDGMVLCFFHAIIDKAAEDNEEVHKTDWTNWCGTPGTTFTLPQCDLLWKNIKINEREAIPDSGPVHVFQVIEAGGQGRVLLSWPPPRLFPRGTDDKLVSQSDTTVFLDGSYFADDYARLAQGVSIAPGSSSLSDANTSCTRRFRAKHTLTTEGKVRSIESVLIPYGGVILACFHTTFQQELPVPDPRLVAQARLTLQAQAERRKPEELIDTAASKRPHLDVADSESTVASVDVPSSSETAATQVEADPQVSSQSQPTAKPMDAVPTQTQSPANNYQYGRPNGSSIDHSIYNHNTAVRTVTTPSNLTKGMNGPGGNVAALAAAAAAQNKSCTGCGKMNSPEWRRGPTGHKTLCNACGLRYARSLSRRKKKKGKDGAVEFIEPTGDPTIVPKSRGGGGGSLPGVHRKNSKKRKSDGDVRAGSSMSSSATPSPSPSVKVMSYASPASTQATSNGGKSHVADPLALPVSAAISKAIAASMEAHNDTPYINGVLPVPDASLGDGSALNPSVSAAALQNMGASALYNQLIQSGLSGLAKSQTDDDGTPLLSADILKAAAQAAVAQGIDADDATNE